MDAFSAADQVQILMHEYDALRAEIRTAIQNEFQLFGIAVVMTTWLLTKISDVSKETTEVVTRVKTKGVKTKRVKTGRLILWLAISLAISTTVYTGTLIGHGMYYLSIRVNAIEQEVNTLIGKHLLRWQTCEKEQPELLRSLWWTPDADCLARKR